MRTGLLALALLVQVVLVPVVGMAAVGMSEHANAYGPGWLAVLAGVLGWSGVLVVVALIRSLTGAGDGMLVVAGLPPVAALLTVLVGGDSLHGNDPPPWVRRRLGELVAIAVTAVPGVLIAAATRYA